MRPSGKRQQMAACVLHILGLVKHTIAQRQRLVAAKHKRARMPFADFRRLCLGENFRHLFRRRARIGQRRLDRALIDLRGKGGEVEAGVG
jgi:hypothetical protein